MPHKESAAGVSNVQDTPSDQLEHARLCIRPPEVSDARAIWKLVRESGALDLNSLYCYLLLCRDFAATSRVAVQAESLAAVVTAYRPPARPECLFVWQIGVASHARRRGLGLKLLNALVASPGCRDCQFVEATVTPSNHASRGLFERFAAEHQTQISIGPGFSQELLTNPGFEDAGNTSIHQDEMQDQDSVHEEEVHEEELRIRVGPLPEFTTH